VFYKARNSHIKSTKRKTMKFTYVNMIILFTLIVKSQSVYENLFCDTCPLTLGSDCQKPQYTCKCVCSVGCNANDGSIKGNGASVSMTDITNIAQLLQPCSTCFVFWSQWDCKDVTTNMNLNACDHYNDYQQYKGNCLASPSIVSPAIATSPPVRQPPIPRRYSPFPSPDVFEPPYSPPTSNNDTDLAIGVGAVLILAWYYILAICLAGVILIAIIIAIICCCCKAVCCC
jgi:hypothetical protein